MTIKSTFEPTIRAPVKAEYDPEAKTMPHGDGDANSSGPQLQSSIIDAEVIYTAPSKGRASLQPQPSIAPTRAPNAAPANTPVGPWTVTRLASAIGDVSGRGSHGQPRLEFGDAWSSILTSLEAVGQPTAAETETFTQEVKTLIAPHFAQGKKAQLNTAAATIAKALISSASGVAQMHRNNQKDQA